jgi:MFS family permease
MSVGSVNIALPSIGKDLSIDNSSLTWVVAAYSYTPCFTKSNGSVANGCFLLTAGRLADLYGRRKVFLYGSVMYFIFTILCAISQNGIMLFVFRAFQGIGGAILVPGAVGIVGATYHNYNKRKAVAFAVIGGTATTGFLAGILLGGVCAQLLTWRWLFYITAIFTAVMVLSAVFIVPKMAGEEEGKPVQRQKYKEIDWWGTFFSISGLVLLSFSLTYVPDYYWLTKDIPLKRQRVGGLGISFSSWCCPLSSLACSYTWSTNSAREQ